MSSKEGENHFIKNHGSFEVTAVNAKETTNKNRGNWDADYIRYRRK